MLSYRLSGGSAEVLYEVILVISGCENHIWKYAVYFKYTSMRDVVLSPERAKLTEAVLSV